MRRKDATFFVVTEQDEDGETWIDRAFYDKRNAQAHADKLTKDKGTLCLVTEMRWDWRADSFKVFMED